MVYRSNFKGFKGKPGFYKENRVLTPNTLNNRVPKLELTILWVLTGLGMYVYVCICMYMYVYVCMYVCMYVYVCICMYMYVYVCICMYMYVCMYVCM